MTCHDRTYRPCILTLAVCLLALAILLATPTANAATLKAPKLTSPTLVSKTSVQVNWNKVSKATGYRVYLVNTDGTLKKVGSTPNKNRTQYVVKGLKKNTEYTFTVRAVKKGKEKTTLSEPAAKTKTIATRYTTKYRKGYRYYYDSNGKRINDVDQIIGKRKSYYIKVNTERCVATVYAWDSKKKDYRIPVKAWLCSPSTYTSSGTWRASDKHRFWALYYSCYSQWEMAIHSPILFHTVPYKSYGSKTSLDVSAYNKLGTPASHGCVRMPCEATKWIYDNCPSGTKVTIYKSSNPGALGKPKLQKIPSWHTWDPTDPTAKSLCTKHKCH